MPSEVDVLRRGGAADWFKRYPNMKTTRALIILLFVALAAIVLHGAVGMNDPMDGLQERPAYTLDVEQPLDFLKKHLHEALVKPEGRLFGDDAIDVTAKVRVCRGGTSVDMEVELLSGVQMDVDEYYIRLCGTPATLDDTYALALRLCALARLPNDRIVKWYREKGYESPLGSAELQTGREGERQHSVNVRSSLRLDGDKLWRVVYTLYFRDHGAGND